MKTATEKSKEMRTELKKAGYNSRQVSVKKGRSLYNNSFRVTVKDLNVNIDKVKQICEKHEHVRQCEFSGEILGGGNNFVFVEWDREMISREAYKRLDEARKVIEDNNNLDVGSGNIVKREGRYQLTY